MTDAEFEQELERYFDSLYRQCAAAQIVYQEASKRFDDLIAKRQAAAALLWGAKANEFIQGYPRNGKPQFDKEAK